MKVTVCELGNDPDALQQDWQSLVAHVQSAGSELVLLPEMAFYPWLAKTRQVDPAAWRASVEAHDQWMLRLDELSPATVVSSRPVIRQGERLVTTASAKFLQQPHGAVDQEPTGITQRMP